MGHLVHGAAHHNFTEEDVMSAFESCNQVLTLVMEKKPSEMVTNAVSDVENMFVQSGVADCDRMVAVFQPKYDANPDDATLLSNIVKLFSSTNCTESSLFRSAVEKLHKTDPSHESAYLLYKLYSGVIGQEDMAVKYMEEAISYETSDSETDAQYYYELATFYYKSLGKNAEAVKMAKETIQLSDDLKAKAYFLIGTIWSTTKCQGNEIERRAPFWVAVDYMEKAKSLDSEFAEEVNAKVSEFKKYYPMQADAFMYNVVDGDSYTISCNGMSETTRVRTQK